MEFIQKLPFLLSVFMAIIIGIISSILNDDKQQVYIQMIIGMLMFFITGLFIRYMLLRIIEEFYAKSKKKEREHEEAMQKGGQTSDRDNSIVDFKADDDISQYVHNDEFLPLRISEIISSENKARN